jgi:glycosyltransferase involved in cell wall biosynthesis
MQPMISVVICTYNRADTLRRALQSLICQETDGQFSYEILVIDDGSSDGTRAVVSEIASRSQVPVRYVCEEGYGIAQARNRCVSESRGEWIAWCDDDQLAEPDWLNQLFAVACRTGADVVGSDRVLSLPDEPVVPLNRVTRVVLGESIYHRESRLFSYQSLPTTGNMLIRRSVLDSVGSFDTSMVYSGEDSDLARRVLAHGFTAWSAPKAVVHHLIPPSRLSAEYFGWVSFRVGRNLAYIDNKEWGRAKTVLACVARIGQALLVNVPLLLWAYLLRDQAEMSGRRCLIWRAVAYARETLVLVAPRLFPQNGFFAALEFRKQAVSFPRHRLCQPGSKPHR